MERPCGDKCPDALFLDTLMRQKRQAARTQLLNTAALERSTSRKERKNIQQAITSCESMIKFYDNVIDPKVTAEAEVCEGPFERKIASENGDITQRACAAFLIARDMAEDVSNTQSAR